MAATNFLNLKPTAEDSKKTLLQRIATGQARGFGEYGTDAITNTSVNNGTWCAITTITATVFATLTGITTGSLAGLTVPAGVTLYSQFTVITLTSGSVLATRR